MSDKMIPFGKYKGQPIEVLQNDPQYAEWIAQQQWARERYPSIVNIIINKFGENEETPDHNAMQAKFMAKWYCAAAYLTLGGFQVGSPRKLGANHGWLAESSCMRQLCRPSVEKLSDLVTDIQFEVGAVDVRFDISGASLRWYWNKFSTLRFESYVYKGGSGGFTAIEPGRPRIELKPFIGDDYPAVLRQMRNNGSNALVYGEYTGIGVPEQTFRAFFATQGIRVCAEKEISDRIAERAKEKISEIKNAIAEQEKILRSRVTVS